MVQPGPDPDNYPPIDPVPLPGGAILRQLDVSDARLLLDSYLRSREHLSPYEPVRPDSFWTLDGQRERLASIIDQMRAGTVLPCTIVRDGAILGCATLNNIIRGPFHNASLGYWIDSTALRQGLASAAVDAICRVADERLGLHRIDAGVMLSNVASQGVLARNGFQRYGTAPKSIHIAGAWRDRHLYQRILNDRPPPS